MIIFLNGMFMEESDCGIAPSDRGFTLGDGVFDTMLAVDGALQHADRHIARLVNHAAVLQIPLPIEADVLQGMGFELLQQNNFTSGRHALRTTLTRGPGTRGLNPPDRPEPTFLMRATPVPDPSEQPLKVKLAQTVRRNERSPLSQIKSLNYGDNLLALMEARDRGFDDALMLNTAGHVVCATTSNLFIEEDGRLVTPPLSDGALDGITRAGLIETSNAREESLSPERVRQTDAIYLTNSIAGIRRVDVFEDREFGEESRFRESFWRDGLSERPATWA